MLTFGLAEHNLKTHSDPKLYDIRSCISSPDDVSKNRLFEYGSYSFIARDLLTIKENGLAEVVELESGLMGIEDSILTLSTRLETLFCDFYSGRDTERFVKVEGEDNLFEKEKTPATTPIQIGQEIVLTIPNTKTARKPKQDQLTLGVLVKNLHVGMYYKGSSSVKITQPRSGFVEFELLSTQTGWNPITFYKSMRKRKRDNSA
jgi:hypothetical protein